MVDPQLELDRMTTTAKSHVLATIRRDRRRSRTRGRVAIVSTVLVAFAGGLALGLPQLGVNHLLAEPGISVAIDSVGATGLVVAVTCDHSGPLQISFGDSATARTEDSCAGSGEVRAAYFEVDGSGRYETLRITGAGSSGLTVQTELVYAASSGPTLFSSGAPAEQALISAEGEDSDGKTRAGFIRVGDVYPPHSVLLDREERASWFQRARLEHPSGTVIPLLDRDGLTHIGTYRITY